MKKILFSVGAGGEGAAVSDSYRVFFRFAWLFSSSMRPGPKHEVQKLFFEVCFLMATGRGQTDKVQNCVEHFLVATSRASQKRFRSLLKLNCLGGRRPGPKRKFRNFSELYFSGWPQAGSKNKVQKFF